MKADSRNHSNRRRRTQQFALRAMKLVDSLPQKRSADVLGKQLARSASSVGANYRASCRARSPADFIAKMGIVEEEADESGYWMELIVGAGLMSAKRVQALMKESDELVAIAVASINTARKGSR